MKVTPRTEDQAQKISKRKLLKPGMYEAKITEAVEKPSSKGNEMIEITVLVSDPDGGDRTFHDYLNNSPLGAAKLRHACTACGVIQKYEAGEVGASDFPGKFVSVRLIV